MGSIPIISNAKIHPWGWQYARDEFLWRWRRLAVGVGFISEDESASMVWTYPEVA